ncbi:hypothetical protein J2X07_001980 [Fictibacillus barbaricus]|uniref:Uncharacterized protein n=1 Tax=Fictibacillus barbaricus TaxID=182136 RepID=A0ABU1U0J1_9BACL|nr:hypothetical protein [Fictibacillus barbaricus]
MYFWFRPLFYIVDIVEFCLFLQSCEYMKKAVRLSHESVRLLGNP